MVPCRLLWTRCRTEALRSRCEGLVASCRSYRPLLLPSGPRAVSCSSYRPLLLSSGPRLSTSTSTTTSTSTSSTKTDKTNKTTDSQKEEEEDEGTDYIPRRKANNPMMPIAYAWMFGLPAGIIGFLLTKREVDKNRVKQLKIRQRMKRSNEGEYEGGRHGNRATTAPD